MSQEDGPNIRSFVVFIVIIFTISTLLRFLAVGGLNVARLALVGLSVWFIYRYLRNQRGYRDRYSQQGQSAANIKYYTRLGILSVFFLFTLSYTSILLEDVGVAFFINALLYAGIIQYADEYFSRDMREYVANKKQADKDFLDSISDPDNIASKCLSCYQKMDPSEQFCPNCGFEQREIKKDTSYLE